jgi:hypothetical protein
MERQRNNIPLLRQGSTGDSNPAAALYGRLDTLNRQVTEFMNDPIIRRMALEVGIVLLAKRYPALSVLLGAFGDTSAKQSAAHRNTVGRKPLPVSKKQKRGI